jgi:hypothetical protein
MESESKNIIQMLKNVKNIIETSKGRDCWASDELKNINITYHNVCEIVKQLENPPKIEELPDEPNDLKELPDEPNDLEELREKPNDLKELPEDLKESEELPESIELKLNN